MCFFMIISVSFIPFYAFSMDTSTTVIQYEYATHTDLPQILNLYDIAHKNENDKKKIVVLPQEIREASLANAIQKKRLFVARSGNTIVGFKKAYAIDNPKELDEILERELRFTENKIVFAAPITEEISHRPTYHQTTYHHIPHATYIYNGSDFTHPAYRGRGINSNLSHAAFKIILQHHKNPVILKMVFGLTKYNAENDTSKSYNDRLPAIAKLFAQSIRETYRPEAPIFLDHAKTIAYMPIFTFHDGKLSISPDNESIEGLGNILTYTHQ